MKTREKILLGLFGLVAMLTGGCYRWHEPAIECAKRCEDIEQKYFRWMGERSESAQKSPCAGLLAEEAVNLSDCNLCATRLIDDFVDGLNSDRDLLIVHVTAPKNLEEFWRTSAYQTDVVQPIELLIEGIEDQIKKGLGRNGMPQTTNGDQQTHQKLRGILERPGRAHRLALDINSRAGDIERIYSEKMKSIARVHKRIEAAKIWWQSKSGQLIGLFNDSDWQKKRQSKVQKATELLAQALSVLRHESLAHWDKADFLEAHAEEILQNLEHLQKRLQEAMVKDAHGQDQEGRPAKTVKSSRKKISGVSGKTVLKKEEGRSPTRDKSEPGGQLCINWEWLPICPQSSE